MFDPAFDRDETYTVDKIFDSSFDVYQRMMFIKANITSAPMFVMDQMYKAKP